MTEKATFVMYKSWRQLFKSLPKEKAADLICAIYDYQTDGECDIEDPAVYAMFSMIRETMDADSAKYDETLKKRKEAGSRGGRPKNQEKAKESKRKHLVSDAFSEKHLQANESKTKHLVSDAFSEKHLQANESKTKQKNPVSESVSESVSVSDSGSSNTGLASGNQPATTAIVSEMDKCGFQINQHLVDECMALSEEYGETWVMEAIRRASESNVRNVRYIHGILKSWKEKGAIDGRSAKDVGPPKKPKYFADEYI